MNESEKIISDLKKIGIEVFKSPIGYYTTKTKKFNSKDELIKEVQKLILNNDYTIMGAKKIGDFMKENLQSNKEWFEELRENGKTTFDYLVEMVGKEKVNEFHDKLKEKLNE